MKLLSENTKTVRGEKLGYKTYILHLAPAMISGYQTCPKASESCFRACLFFAGMGKFQNVQDARIAKTKLFFENREEFMVQLVKDTKSAIKKAAKEGMKLAIRLNGTSDLPWWKFRVTVDGVEYRNIMEAFPTVKWYDYTKIPNAKGLPENYHLTFSRSGANDADVQEAIKNNMNVAVVFNKSKKEELPESYMGLPVINGDSDDARFLDPKNVIVGLVIKGTNAAKRMAVESGFAV